MGQNFFIEIAAAGETSDFVLLPEGRTIVGRSAHTCSIVIEDKRVSRVHLQIERDAEQGVRVQDLYSANGTRLEGRELPVGMVLNWLLNQTIQIGAACLVLRYGAIEG